MKLIHQVVWSLFFVLGMPAAIATPTEQTLPMGLYLNGESGQYVLTMFPENDSKLAVLLFSPFQDSGGAGATSLSGLQIHRRQILASARPLIVSRDQIVPGATVLDFRFLDHLKSLFFQGRYDSKYELEANIDHLDFDLVSSSNSRAVYLAIFVLLANIQSPDYFFGAHQQFTGRVFGGHSIATPTEDLGGRALEIFDDYVRLRDQLAVEFWQDRNMDSVGVKKILSQLRERYELYSRLFKLWDQFLQMRESDRGATYPSHKLEVDLVVAKLKDISQTCRNHLIQEKDPLFEFDGLR